MTLPFLLIQLLNGVQYGLVLFLIASGLTLIFGVMRVINMAHGSFFMVGAYLAFALAAWTGSFWLALLLVVPLGLALGAVIERLLVRFLHGRDHLTHVLLTFALILALNEGQSLLFGDDPHAVPVPEWLAGSVPLTPTLSYPFYGLFLCAMCLAVALGLGFVMGRTRIGMIIRAGAVNPEMVAALGIDLRRISTAVFAAGAGLAALAGALDAPVRTVYPGMGEQVVILCFVVVVIGGPGSVRGAFLAALAIGLADTFGKVFVPAFASVAVYVLMAAVLLVRPRGLFGSAGA